MVTEKNQEEEFIIPTRYKTQIGSYLSWPVGAMELTKALLGVPQIRVLELRFSEHYPKYPKGKWPASFRVIEAQYTYHRTQYAPFAGWNDVHWYFDVFPVPRNMRAEIRVALQKHGFRTVAEWLLGHAAFSGRESSLRYTGHWNSETKELSFGSHEYVLPEVSAVKQRNRK